MCYRNKTKYYIPFFFLFTQFISLKSQDVTEDDAFFIQSIFANALEDQKSYDWLYHISENIGGRIAGSPQSEMAIEYTLAELAKLPGIKAYKQPCMVNYWFRGKKQMVAMKSASGLKKNLNALALGGSGAGHVKAEVLEFKSLDEVRENAHKIKDNIVFFNRPFDNTQLRTFSAYGGAVDQRYAGPNLVSKLGGKACIVRSMTGRKDDHPHTGGTFFEDGVKSIPALAISTNDANYLSSIIKKEKVFLHVETECEEKGPRQSYSVIGEIKGTVFPDEIIVIGGHIDSWDVGGGAHDDGAGITQSMEVLYLLFKKLNYTPKRTIRCVLFQNEENGLAGGRTYADISNANKEFHLAAIESDAGGFTPQGFSFDADTSVITSLTKNLKPWQEILEPYNLTFDKGGSGADIGPLKSQKGMLFGLRPDSQRYFDYHHTAQDRIQAVHPRELALGSAAMASLVYLIDKYGLK